MCRAPERFSTAVSAINLAVGGNCKTKSFVRRSRVLVLEIFELLATAFGSRHHSPASTSVWQDLPQGSSLRQRGQDRPYRCQSIRYVSSRASIRPPTRSRSRLTLVAFSPCRSLLRCRKSNSNRNRASGKRSRRSDSRTGRRRLHSSTRASSSSRPSTCERSSGIMETCRTESSGRTSESTWVLSR